MLGEACLRHQIERKYLVGDDLGKIRLCREHAIVAVDRFCHAAVTLVIMGELRQRLERVGPDRERLLERRKSLAVAIEVEEHVAPADPGGGEAWLECERPVVARQRLVEAAQL